MGHQPPGRKAGVIRGRGSNRMIMWNGHPAISPETAERITKLIRTVNRKITTREAAVALNYSASYMRVTMRSMAIEKMLVQTPYPGSRHTACLYGLPGGGDEPPVGSVKRCAACGETLPLRDFHKDKARADGYCTRCRFCRSPRKGEARTYHRPTTGCATSTEKLRSDTRA